MLRLLRKGQPRYAETFVCDVMKQTLRVCGPVKLRKFQKEEENHGKSLHISRLWEASCYLCWCYLRQSKLLRHLLSCTATTSCTRTDFEATAGRWSFFVTAVVVWSVQDLKPQNIMLAESLKWDLNDLNGRWYTIAECYIDIEDYDKPWEFWGAYSIFQTYFVPRWAKTRHPLK